MTTGQPSRDPSADSTDRPPAAAGNGAPAAKRRARWPRVVAIAAVPVLLVAVLVALLALPYTAAGSRWLLSWVPGLSLQSPAGPLLGAFSAERLVWRGADGMTVAVEGLSWPDLQWHRDTGSAVGWRLQWPVLQATRVAVTVGKPAATPQPTRLPSSITLPLGIDVDRLQIDRIDLDTLPDQPVRDLRAAVHLGAGPAAVHRIDGLALQWERLIATGQASLQARAPLGLHAHVNLAAAPTGTGSTLPDWLADWQASVAVEGPLRRLVAQAQVKARQQSLQAEAVVQPESPQPLAALQVQATRFDLAALSARWPRTALTGRIALRHDATVGSTPAPRTPQAGDRPITIEAQLRNEAAGTLADEGLPLRSLLLTARSDSKAPRAGRIEAFRAELGTARQDAGRIEGRGTWAPGAQADTFALALSLQLENVQPAVIDPRAPPWRLAGGLNLSGQTDGPLRLRGEVRGAAAQQAAAPVATVTLDAEAAWRPSLAVTLHDLRAQAGAGQAQAQGRVRQSAAGWQVVADGRLEAFDPSVWWPGSADQVAWRRGPHRLDARVQADVLWPANAASGQALALRGHAGADIAPSSRLAGVPLSGRIGFDNDGRAGRAQAALQAGDGAQAAQIDGEATLQGTASARGAQDLQATLRWRVPALAALTPWLQLAQPADTWQGDAAGSLQLSGRWPDWRGRLQLDSRQLAYGRSGDVPTTVRGLAVQAQAGRRPDDPLQLDATAESARAGTLLLERLQARLSGTAAAHRLQVQTAALPAARSGGASAAARRNRTALRTVLQAEGGVFGLDPATAAARPWGWDGRITEWTVADEPPATATAATTTKPAGTPAQPQPWVRLAPTTMRFQQAPDGRRELQAGATRVQVGDAALVLAPSQWAQDARGQSLSLQADLEPWSVAPLLARWQPDFGWRGDLRVRGALLVRATPDNLKAALSIDRVSGDLVVHDPSNLAPPQPLELTELQWRLDADRGQWHLQERVAGSRMGALAGDQRLRTAANAWVPPADTAIDGDLTLQVAEVGQWGRWLPAGWRLAGYLVAEARLAGTLGSPTVTGELHGQSLAVRNLLEGVDWRDAEVHLRLAGDQARIDQLRVRAGAGWLTATGQAHLGRQARLELQARADRFAALQRVDRRVVISGDAQLVVDPSTLQATARLTADEGRIDVGQADAPTLADDVQVRRPGDAPPGTASTNGGNGATCGRRVALDIRADLGPAFLLRGRGLNARLAGELHLTSPGNRPQLTGSVRAVDGTYAAYGQKLGIERGLIAFGGEVNNPRLDILAVRSDIDTVKVGVAVTGTAQAPRVRLYSDPSLSDTDKLSWLLLGRGSDGLGGTDLAMLQRAAYAVIAGDNDKPGVVQRLGLDNLSVGQRDATSGDTTVRQTVVSLGKQLSQRWYVGYERSLQATAGSWQLIYRLAQRYTVRAQSGYTAAGVTENAIDLIWTWRWGQ